MLTFNDPMLKKAGKTPMSHAYLRDDIMNFLRTCLLAAERSNRSDEYLDGCYDMLSMLATQAGFEFEDSRSNH